MGAIENLTLTVSSFRLRQRVSTEIGLRDSNEQYLPCTEETHLRIDTDIPIVFQQSE